MLKRWTQILLSLMAFSAFGAEFVINKENSALALNGVKFEESKVDLVAGTHQIVARYSFQLPEKGNKKKRIQSEVKVFQFTVANQETIRLIAPNFARYSQAEYAFNNDSIDWRLEDENGDPVEFTVDFIPGRSGFLPYGDIERVVEDYNKKNSIAVDPVKGIVTLSTVASDEPSNGLPALLNDVQSQYLNLSADDRKAFKKWLVDIE
jgi:uncharacterized protein YccT (UPF0319 family)